MSWFNRTSEFNQILATQRTLLANDAVIIAAQKTLQTSVNLVIEKGNKIMAGITDIQAAEAAEKADLVTLTGLVSQLLAAFASGAMTPDQAQALLDNITGDDTTVKTNISAIQAALPAPPPIAAPPSV